jgi:uncharacterized membrane protein
MTAMRQTLLWRGVLALAVAGVGISGYLTYTHFAHKPVICAGLGSCATVQASEYATVAGVPVALFGLVSFLAIGVLAVLAVSRPWAALAVFGLALSGVLYSAYLTWVELAVLDAVCLWCAASAVVITAIAVVSGQALFATSAPATAPDPPARTARRPYASSR